MADLATADWRLIREEVRDGPVQMALDEVAAETAATGGPRTVRVYSWEPSTLSLGYQQDPETVDWEFCDREGISTTRRQTGGGGIYHDRDGDISYSIAVPADEVPGDLLTCYELLCEPILDAFDRLGIDARFADEQRPAIYQPACYLRAIHPAHDILASGRKISGNAQYRTRDGVVQHGSLSFAITPTTHLSVFTGHDVTPDDFTDRVTSITECADVDRERAVGTLEDSLAEWVGAHEGTWSDEELEAARQLADEKYSTDEWNHGHASR